nr:methyltransferase domain-containing protein [Rhodoferax sp.]
MPNSNVDASAHFNDPIAVCAYVNKTRRLVPGWADLQKMAALLAAERAPEQASMLVVGAGGGVELKAFAEMYSQWRFVGVDPSKPMLELAEAALGPQIACVRLHHGYVDTAPAGPFDAATCLLTMHFVAIDERRATLREIERRLKPGAPFVMAHMSFPQAPGERELWPSRYVAFAIFSGVDPEDARNAASAIGTRLPLLGPDEEDAMLVEAGFAGTRLFYAGLAFRGWVTYA